VVEEKSKQIKVLINGASSFIGFNLAIELHKKFTVLCAGRNNRTRLDFETLRLRKLQNEHSLPLFDLDLTSQASIQSLIQSQKPDVWIHHAGYTAGYQSNSEYDFKTSLTVNVEPLKFLYECLAQNGCKLIISTGSSAEYSDSELEHDEAEACSPKTLYGLSKLLQTNSMASLSSIYSLPTVVVRVFNLFGEGENPNKLFSLIKQSYLTGNPIALTSCIQERSLISVKQLCLIYQKCIERQSCLNSFEIINAVNRDSLKLIDFLINIKELQNILLFNQRKMRKDEYLTCIGSSQKLKEKLNLSFTKDDVLQDLNSYFLT
jgi:nucleoside-diphosphate-sugar epimerase